MDSDAKKALAASRNSFDDPHNTDDNERVYYNSGSAIDGRTMILKPTRTGTLSVIFISIYTLTTFYS